MVPDATWDARHERADGSGMATIDDEPALGTRSGREALEQLGRAAPSPRVVDGG
jgi:hypothetical protein